MSGGKGSEKRGGRTIKMDVVEFRREKKKIKRDLAGRRRSVHVHRE